MPETLRSSPRRSPAVRPEPGALFLPRRAVGRAGRDARTRDTFQLFSRSAIYPGGAGRPFTGTYVTPNTVRKESPPAPIRESTENAQTPRWDWKRPRGPDRSHYVTITPEGPSSPKFRDDNLPRSEVRPPSSGAKAEMISTSQRAPYAAASGQTGQRARAGAHRCSDQRAIAPAAGGRPSRRRHRDGAGASCDGESFRVAL